jgi:hypothetical protein
MESRLQCRQSVIFEHVQQCLYRMLLVEISQETFKLDIPSFRHYPTQGREFLRSCAPNLRGSCEHARFPTVYTGRLTQLRKDIPEPVDNEHGG